MIIQLDLSIQIRNRLGYFLESKGKGEKRERRIRDIYESTITCILRSCDPRTVTIFKNLKDL